MHMHNSSLIYKQFIVPMHSAYKNTHLPIPVGPWNTQSPGDVYNPTTSLSSGTGFWPK